jgi:hypothetical protein
MDRGAVPVGDLHEHLRRALVDLRALAAHDAGQRRRAGGVVDHQHVVVQRAGLVVERGELLAVIGATDDQQAVGDAAEVEGVQRAADEQHHVVGDVDDVVDRALASGHQARLQPRR